MALFYCKCLTCNHTGSVKIDSDKCTGNFVCSKCGSKDTFSARCGVDTEKEYYVSYYNDWYENKIYEEERRLLDKIMMAPTGWEDDKDIQEYIGVSPENLLESDIFMTKR